MPNPELRMSMYRRHIKHCARWELGEPLDWHTWKFKVWPPYADMDTLSEDDEIDIIMDAAGIVTAWRRGR